jgi:hypothetical protein
LEKNSKQEVKSVTFQPILLFLLLVKSIFVKNYQKMNYNSVPGKLGKPCCFEPVLMQSGKLLIIRYRRELRVAGQVGPEASEMASKRMG